MNIEEAKELYFRYDGHFFHMDREESVKANLLRGMGLGPEVYRAWDEEMLQQYFDRLWADPERVWSVHSRILAILGRILAILGRGRSDVEHWCAELLQQMDRMAELDLFNKTLILENMAGRTASGKDGGVYLFCTGTELAEAMDKTVRAIIRSAGDEDDERFCRAVKNYQAAYVKWQGQRKR